MIILNLYCYAVAKYPDYNLFPLKTFEQPDVLILTDFFQFLEMVWFGAPILGSARFLKASQDIETCQPCLTARLIITIKSLEVLLFNPQGHAY
jgi:hypothetical protein